MPLTSLILAMSPHQRCLIARVKNWNEPKLIEPVIKYSCGYEDIRLRISHYFQYKIYIYNFGVCNEIQTAELRLPSGTPLLTIKIYTVDAIDARMVMCDVLRG